MVYSYDEKLDRMHYCEDASDSDQYYTEDEDYGYPYDSDEDLRDILFAHLFSRSYGGESPFDW